MVDRMPLTALMGVVLGYLCWQSRSILPGVLFHACHNAWPMVLTRWPDLARWLGMIDESGEPTHLRTPVIVSAVGIFLLGVLIIDTMDSPRSVSVHEAPQHNESNAAHN